MVTSTKLTERSKAVSSWRRVTERLRADGRMPRVKQVREQQRRECWANDRSAVPGLYLG
jgi:hypothetical protein